MDSGSAVHAPGTTPAQRKGAAAEKLAETRARCEAALTAADGSVRRAQAALAIAEERLRRAREMYRIIQQRRTSGDAAPCR